MAEPAGIASLLALAGVLMALSVALSRAAGRVRLPVQLLLLALGVTAGAEGLGRIVSADYAFAYRIGTTALVLILFDGGLNTPASAFRAVLGPSAVLATVGVVLTAAMVGVGAHLLGIPWPTALLVGAVVSSTDAATVFAVLRSSRIELKRRLASTLELESGLNDPIAALLTVALTDVFSAPVAPAVLARELVLQLVVGVVGGAALGRLGRVLVRLAPAGASGLAAVSSTAVALAAFGLPTLLHGSGFLAVYVAGAVLGAGTLPYRAGLLRVHDALAWLAQVLLFLMLGLLCFPSRLVAVAGVGVALTAILAFVARPVAVLLCLLPFRFPAREIAHAGWTGLRGAVPIVLATYPIMAGVPGAEGMFDLVFFVVVVSAIVPGATVRWVTRRLGVETKGPPPPPAMLEIVSREPLGGEVLSFYVSAASAVAGARLAELPLPVSSTVMLIVRGGQLVPPRGETTLEAGDHVWVVARSDARELVLLLFGAPDEN